MLLVFLGITIGWSAPMELLPQTITLPGDASPPLFADPAGNGRCDLFVIDQAEKKLLRYRQGPEGFTNAPAQFISLPPQTAWVALADVDPHPGLELVMSTAAGLVYSRQNDGQFESATQVLVAASQVFAPDEQPILTSLNTNRGSSLLLPVITAGQTWWFQRNAAYEWRASPARPLNPVKTDWYTKRNPWRNAWRLGQNSTYEFKVEQSFRTTPEPKADQKPENEVIGKILEDMKKTDTAWPAASDPVDLDGDGRMDLMIWQVSGKLDFKTDLYLFLRGANQQLPERPSEALHESGFPIPTDSTTQPSPLADLRRDGHHELVLLEFNTSVLSYAGLIQTALSHGLDWKLTIRQFQNGGFSRRPDAWVPVTMTMPAQVINGWPIFIQGDFNGDGRPDLLVRRSDTRWNVLFSTTDGRWFDPEPALTFDSPVLGYPETQDLQGDGRADVIWHNPTQHTLTIFRSPSQRPAGNKP